MRVLICGAGLGGLLLAYKLVKEKEKDDDIEVVVLERDESPTSRSQGIVIGLAQGGVDALGSVGLDSILEQLMSPNGAMNVTLRSQAGAVLINGNNWLRVKLANGQYVSSLVSRVQLRTKLAEVLPPGTIKWNARVVNVKEEPGSPVVRVELATGEIIEGNLLVAADGARSSIRKTFFPQLEPRYLGIFNTWGTVSAKGMNLLGISNQLLNAARQALVRTNGWFGCSLLSFVYVPKSNTEESIFFWALSLPNEFAEELMDSELTRDEMRGAVVALVQRAFEDPDIETLMKLSEHVAAGYELTSVEASLYSSGAITTASTSSLMITLLGDAAHKTTTHAGLGATGAFQDAVDLGETILKRKTALSASDLREYEKRMCSRAQNIVNSSLTSTKMIHSIKGGIGMLVANTFMWVVGHVLSVADTLRYYFKG